MAAQTKNPGLFDYLVRFIEAINNEQYKEITAYGMPSLLCTSDSMPASRAQTCAVSMLANYLILGYENADPERVGYISMPNQMSLENPNSLILDPRRIQGVDLKEVRERLDILKDFWCVRHQDFDYDRMRNVLFGPVPEEYMDTMTQSVYALNMFAQNNTPDSNGMVPLEAFEGIETFPFGDEMVLMTSIKNCQYLFRYGTFNPFKLVRVHSVTEGFDLKVWNPDCRMS